VDRVSDLVIGPDGLARCSWAASAPENTVYHDTEWGWPLRTETGLFEHLVLEAFQSGLSWLTVLRKRANFRAGFADFDIARVAAFGAKDVKRLLDDPGIVRNRAKIEASIANARAAADLPDGLSALLWSFAPTGRRKRPRSLADIVAVTPESQAMAKDLKKRGFRFVGPTTSHALMQATGMVNDHLVGCHVHPV